MSKKSEDNDIIARAAAAHLAPLGCKRVGRSRVWLSDQRAWAIMIEFQPSSFSKGSYLNVAPSWLWYPKNHLTFDYGPVRFNGFISFEDVEQFESEAEGLAAQAAQAVIGFREELDTPQAIATRLTELAGDNANWQTYHAAVATGLTGDSGASLRLFAQIISSEHFIELRNHCAGLASKLSNQSVFRESILAIISRTRVFKRLPEDPHCLDDWYARDE